MILSISVNGGFRHDKPVPAEVQREIASKIADGIKTAIEDAGGSATGALSVGEVTVSVVASSSKEL